MQTFHLKEQVSLLDIGRYINVPLRLGYQTCPFCRRDNKLRVTETHYKCFYPKPACGRSGDIFQFLQDYGKAQNFKEAVRFVERMVGASYQSWSNRISLFERVFQIYKEDINDECLQFLESRGYNPEHIEFGYAHPFGALNNRGLDLESLEINGLLYANTTREFFTNRVIFPIRDARGRIVHFQGRSLDPNEEVRWLSTGNINNHDGYSIASINKYLFNAHRYSEVESIECLFLSEGISDGLSLQALGVDYVSCFGVEVDLVRNSELFGKCNHLIVVLDNDKYALGTELQGLYKSWTPMLKRLAQLQEVLPKLKIWAVPPPSKPGLKDINDWLKQGLTVQGLSKHCQTNGKALFSFAVEALGDYLEYQQLLLKLLAVNRNETDCKLMSELVSRKYGNDWMKYVLDIIQ